MPEALIKALSTETDGNPFFIRELLLHLVEEGKIFREDGRWTATLAMEELGIPEGAREVIGRRLSRLSSDANSLLAVASAFNGTFRFGLAASVAGLDDAAALRAVDEALAAQLIRSGTEADSYDFTRSLIRHTLYSELNPSRQVRTHRQIAEAMEAAWGARVGEHAAEVAYQYSRSAVLPGAEHGAVHAIAAADKAEAAYAHEEVVGFLKMALALLAPDEAWRPRLLGRLGLALARTANFDEAPRVVQEAGRLIARTEGNPAATGYFAQAVVALHDSGGVRYAWTLANEGLAYAGERRDFAWVTLTVFDVDREDAERPDNPGLRLPSPRRKELFTVYQTLPTGERGDLLWLTPYASRDRILAEFGDRRGALTFRAGEFRKAIPLWETSAADAERNGRLATAVVELASLAQCYVALGEFGAARGLLRKAQAIAARLPAESSSGRLQLLACRDQFQIATDEGWQEALPVVTSMIGRPTAETAWAFAAIRATGARIAARLGQAEQAVALLGTLIAPLELSPADADDYIRISCDAASTLWMLNRTEHIGVIERSIREKVVKPDFRYPMFDGRLSLARLCALQGRHDEAAEWLAKARTVLEEQGARPLRAIADFDEGWMYIRRNTPGDRERARSLLETAMAQFKSIGMTGWLRRAEGLALGAN